MEKIFIWGTGKIANRIVNHFDLSRFDILGFIDNEEEKQGTLFKEYSVFPPAVLKNKDFDKVLILCNAFQEISNQITKEYHIHEEKIKDALYLIRESVVDRYQGSEDSEIQEIMEYLKDHKLQVFNYGFADDYNNMQVEIYYDNENTMFYVIHQGKKMYFSRKFDTESKVLEYYRSICLEQDPRSPHAYFDDNFKIDEGEVVVDLGAAEGNFSLDIIDKASKVYIIEADKDWVEALELTFKEYASKVVIINTYISDVSSGNYDTLDHLITEPVDFIKMDIEGYECQALIGAKNLFGISPRIKCDICAYHRTGDEENIVRLLEQYAISYTTTKGYMWYPFLENEDAYSNELRRGVIRGEK